MTPFLYSRLTLKYWSKNPQKCRKYAVFQLLLWYNKCMENSVISMDELNKLPREAVVILCSQMSQNISLMSNQLELMSAQNENNSKQLEQMQKQNEDLLKLVADLKEQVAILTQQRFGSKSEKNLSIPGQMAFDFDGTLIFNEAEATVPDELPEETPIEEVITYSRKKPGKRQQNIVDVDVEIAVHDLSEEELNALFPNGWKRLDDEEYSELKYVPSKFLVIKHVVKVYKDKEKIVRGKAPARLLPHSIVSPELAAAVFNAKYVNAVPLNRLSEEFLRQDVNIPRQDMASWMIRINRYYLGPIHDMFKKELLKSHHIHCDETPFTMPEHGKQYMWVYHSTGGDDNHPVFLYEYPGTRGAAAPDAYLKEYQGILVTDGYESYHTLARRRPDDLKVAGCWAHAKRRFAEIVKAAKKKQALSPSQEIAAEAVKKIDYIYHIDNKYKESSEEDVLDNRQKSVKPLVDAYFAWIKETLSNPGLDKSSKLVSALNYSRNQEKYLRVFLDDPKLPLDNNDAERSIKKFCVGKKNWQIIDSKNGAEASAMMYSLAETIKANRLKPYEYFSYLLSQLKEYPRNNVPEDVLADLMPWSDKLPDECRKNKTR